MTPPDTPVREVTRYLCGCVRQNHAQDVLDVLDALGLSFMPVVEDFSDARVAGVVTRAGLETALERHGSSARVAQAAPILLPMVADDTPVGLIATLAGEAPAYVITRHKRRLVGIYQPERSC